jgi:hypothetical protein
MTTTQANGAHLPDVDFLRYFSLSYSERSRHDRSPTLLTAVNTKMKVLFFHPRSVSRGRVAVLINLDLLNLDLAER